MGINIPANSSLGIDFFSILSFFFFVFSANMNLAVFAGILLAVPMATARRASLGEKTMQTADEADEPDEAMRGSARPARLVEKIMRAADEADEPEDAKRAKRRPCLANYEACVRDRECCSRPCRKRFNTLQQCMPCLANYEACVKDSECCSGHCRKRFNTLQQCMPC